MKSTLGAWVPIAIVCACRSNPLTESAPRSGAPADVEDAYCSLLAAAPDRFRDEQAPVDLFVVSRATAPIFDSHEEFGASALWRGLSEKLPSLQRDTFDDFWSRKDETRVPFSFAAAGDSRVEYIGIAGPYTPKSAGSSGDEYKRLRVRYSNSYLIYLSCAGWSADGRQGLVYVVFSGWCGVYFVMAKSGDTWQLAEEFCAWIT